MQKSSPIISEPIINSTKILWDYMHMNNTIHKSDIVIAMGSHDLRVAEYAARLVLDGWAPLLLCSGNLGRLTNDKWRENEASLFASSAMKMGLSKKKILLEDRSTNTSENIFFSRELCIKHNIPITSIILVHKPYMERRVWATVRIAWPDIIAIVSSPPISFEEYPTQEISLENVIDIMVGDFQRLLIYPKKGFALPQEIPTTAMKAFNYLKQGGFTKHLI